MQRDPRGARRFCDLLVPLGGRPDPRIRSIVAWCMGEDDTRYPRGDEPEPVAAPLGGRVGEVLVIANDHQTGRLPPPLCASRDVGQHLKVPTLRGCKAG